MIPGARTAEGQLRIVAGPPAATDPRLGGFALTPLGEIYAVGTQSAFSPADLFLNSEQGAWYDPSDLTTMFQDSAGTTPVTADGQPVGLILDKSKGLVLGPELVTNGGFDSESGWTLSAGFSISGGQLKASAAAAGASAYTSASIVTAGKYYEISVKCTSYTSGTWGIYFPGQAVKTGLSGTGTFTYRALVTSSGPFFPVYADGTLTADFDNVSVRELPGNHASQATSTARPLYKTDGTYHWLQFDGVDDSLSTAAIDFTATNKMSLFSGFVKGSSAAWKYIFGNTSNSDSTVGSFGFYAPGGTDTSIDLYGKGSLAVANKSIASAASGIKLTSTGKIDLSASVSINTNGGSFNTTSSNMGGNFANDILVVGMRGDGLYKFQGNIYSLIVRGALSTPEEVAETETWVNGKTGAY